MNNLAVITARSGSKGLKDKNIKPLGGRPLLASDRTERMFRFCARTRLRETTLLRGMQSVRRYRDMRSWGSGLTRLLCYNRHHLLGRRKT